jgi:hypothetical protein
MLGRLSSESGKENAPPKLSGFDPKMDRTSPWQVVTQIGNTKEMLLHYCICFSVRHAERTWPRQDSGGGNDSMHIARVKLAASARGRSQQVAFGV